MGSQFSPKKGAAPVFGPCLFWPKLAGWMKTPLDTEVDLGSGHIVLVGDPARLPPPLCERGTAVLPFFRPMSIEATVAHLIYC